MATTQISNNSTSARVFPRRRYRVEIKPSWSSEWRDFDYLRVEQCTEAAAPTMSRAVFTWITGNVKHEDRTTFDPYAATDIKDWFIRVTVLGTSGQAAQILGPYVVPEEQLAFGGTAHGPAGAQTMLAFGLEHLLDRRVIQTCWANGDGGSAGEMDVTSAFNERYRFGFNALGNRSDEKITTNVNDGKTDGNGNPLTPRNATAYVFSNNGKLWTSRNIIEYLLAYFGDLEVPFTLGGQLEALDATILPSFEYAGETLYGILNKLIDRRRGLGWCIRNDSQGAGPEIHVFSAIGEPVSVGDANLPANAEKVNLDLRSAEHRIGPVGLSVDSQSRFGKIIVQGQPIVVMFTLSVKDETLDRAWTSAEETAYKAGSGDGTNAQKNDAERSTDKFAHVFTTFRVPRNWNWKAGDGEGGKKTNQSLVNIRCNDDGRVIETTYDSGGNVTDGLNPATYRNWGHTLLDHLPLPADEASLDFDKERDYRKPFVVLKYSTDRYVMAEKAGAMGKPAAQLRMLDRSFGFEVRAHANHIMARAHWDNTVKATQFQPEWNWEEMIATVAMRIDHRLRVEVSLPYQTFDGEENDVKQAKIIRLASRVLVIDVPDAELWWCVPNTVTDVKDGKLQRKNVDTAEDAVPLSQMLLRDDSPRLRQIGALAKAWYGKTRAAITVPINGIDLGARVGSYVVAAQDNWRNEEVNSIISEKVYAFGEQQMTTIRTAYAELDPRIADRGGARFRVR